VRVEVRGGAEQEDDHQSQQPVVDTGTPASCRAVGRASTAAVTGTAIRAVAQQADGAEHADDHVAGRHYYPM
jgi:hypothetical protein